MKMAAAQLKCQVTHYYWFSTEFINPAIKQSNTSVVDCASLCQEHRVTAGVSPQHSAQTCQCYAIWLIKVCLINKRCYFVFQVESCFQGETGTGKPVFRAMGNGTERSRGDTLMVMMMNLFCQRLMTWKWKSWPLQLEGENMLDQVSVVFFFLLVFFALSLTLLLFSNPFLYSSLTFWYKVS